MFADNWIDVKRAFEIGCEEGLGVGFFPETYGARLGADNKNHEAAQALLGATPRPYWPIYGIPSLNRHVLGGDK